MPEGSRRSGHRLSSNTAAKRPSSVSSLSGIVGRMMSSADRGPSSSSCTSVNTVCSDGTERPASLSLSSSASSVSLQDTSHSSSSSSSSSSLPYGAVPTYGASPASSSSTPKRNGSDISLDLTPLVGGRGGACGVIGHLQAGGQPAVAPPRQLSRLERVVLEIVETEQAYVRDLKSIVEDYLGCIIDSNTLPLKPEQVSTLFCNVEDIYEFNSDLLEDLERCPHAAAIAECFVERSEAFDIYTLYCMNYPNSVAVLRDCMKNQSLVHFFQERQMTLHHSLPLETYLLKPVQRILKYHLLLQELSKHFDKSDSGYEVVEDAIITMTAVAWYINDMKRKQEHAVRLQEIESLLVNWSGPDLSGFGELVLEGSFKVQRVKKERAFFLFDKMLLIAKKRLEQFVYSTHIFCCNLLLVENLKDPLCFKVSDQTIPKQQHTVQTKNQEEKRLWVHYLKRLIVENHPASLPQKARQVLGDNLCQSLQFDQENLRKSSTPSRLEDIHSYHRGRRQSEPPELLMCTPEKSRRGLPLLLEGNLPYRRTRRQSAPAKDIEAVFHPDDLKQADSEGELRLAHSLASAGSSSTLASSVIEVEAERPEGTLNQEPQTANHKTDEDDEEELVNLSPPPTLSITEEILEFINQSRAREGLAAITYAVDEDPVPSEESGPQCDPCNFTSPLPSHANLDQEATVQEGPEADTLQQLPAGLHGGEEEHHQQSEAPGVEIKEAVELKDEDTLDETQSERVEKNQEDDRIVEEAEKEGRSREDLDLASKKKTSSLTVDQSPSSGPDLLNCIQKGPPATKASHLTKHDKRIIEKIRSYYEAAAKAEEDDEEEEENSELEEGGESTRRDSFSHIPSGLVKESVSRFDEFGHQGEPESQKIQSEANNTSYRKEDLNCRTDCPAPNRLEVLSEPEDNREADGAKCSQSSDAEGELSTASKVTETPREVAPIQKSPTKAEEEAKEGHRRVNREPAEEVLDVYQEEQEAPGQEDGPRIAQENISSKEATENRDHIWLKEHERKQSSSPETHKKLPKESVALEEPKSSTRYQSSWVRKKPRDPTKVNRNVDGPWSYHSRIVTSNRALFEAMGSDVASIGLFEATPEVDPVLIENSERILSKVQTLAQMFGAKAGSMKVPLHQKRGISTQSPPWDTVRSSGSHDKNKTHVQTQTQQHNGKDSKESDNDSIELKTVDQNNVYRQVQQQKTFTQPSNSKKILKATCDSLILGHMCSKESVTESDTQQDKRLTLSRPRDFISSSAKPSDCNKACDASGNHTTVTTSQQNPSSSQNHQAPVVMQTKNSSSGTHPHKAHDPHKAQTDDVTLNHTVNDLLVHDGATSEERNDSVNQNRRVLLESEELGGKDKGELGGESQRPSVEESTRAENKTQLAQFQENPSKLQTSQERQPVSHCEEGPSQSQTSASLRKQCSVQPGAALSGCSGHKSGETSQGELVLVLAPKQVQASLIHSSSLLLRDGPLGSELTDHRTAGGESSHWSEPDEARLNPLSMPSGDFLPTFTNQRPPYVASRNTSSSTTTKQRQTDPDSQFYSGQPNPYVTTRTRPSSACLLDTSSLEETPTKAYHNQDKEPSRTSSAFRPGLRQRSPSPFRALTSSCSIPASPCSSPFKTTAPSPPPATPTTSPTPCSGVPTPPPTSSIRAGPPSSPVCSSFLRSPSCSSPISSSSVFTRSLAASCISQSISQSIARKSLAQQQGSTVNLSPHLRMRSPSPKPAPCHQDPIKDDSKQVKCTPPSHWSSSPALRQSPTSCSSQHLPSVNHGHCRPSPSSPQQSCLQPRTESSQNFNNNNNRSCVPDRSVKSSGASVINGCGPSSPQKMLLSNGNHDSLWSGSHNRVPRPFSASEPNSRVQSPSPSTNPASGIPHLHSPPPQHSYSSMASKPPHPRSGHVACRNTHNPLGLTLEIPRASSFSLTCPSPQILSPPPIGVSVNVWTQNVAAPQPRNPRLSSNSPDCTSILTQESTAFPTSSALFPLESSGTSSPSLCSDPRQTVSFNLQRSFSSSLSDTHSGPLASNHAGLRSCWQDNRQRPLGFNGSFDQHESCSTSPRSEWSSHSGSPSCLSPLAGLESPISSSRPPSRKSSHCGQHFTSVSWPDVQELSYKYNGTDGGESSTKTASSSSFSRLSQTTETSSDRHTEWEEPTLQQDSCRTQLICAYVARPSQERNLTSTPQPQVQSARTSPSPSVSSTLSPSSSPLPFSSSKQKSQKSSYATTINLQIAGSGKITSFSTAQVSLTQTLQGGVGAPGQGQEIRRVSVNGLSLLPPAVPQV